MCEFLKHIHTGVDQHTYDWGRVVGTWAVATYTVLAGYDLFQGHSFNPAAYGAGLAAIIAAVGANLLMKKDTEPKP
ncbi:MAG TPA: hypothetical protein DEP05_02845 [Betaproteobacteria bacterium]|nr:hypothetical protein [Betaproteobacteria bacterium]